MSEPLERPQPHLSPALDPWGLCLSASLAWLSLLLGSWPGAHGYDTGEWIAAPRVLALAHPPGHPLTLLSSHLAQLAPWFDAAARANLASGLWLSLGVGALYHALWRLLTASQSSQHTPHLTIRLSASLGALSLIALPLVWLQGVRAEVYASQCALVALSWAAWAELVTRRDQRALLWGGLSLGLQASNHTLLALAHATPVLLWSVWAWLAPQKSQASPSTPLISARALLGSMFTALCGVSLYAYLALRGRAGGVIGWGWVSDWASFWETLSAKVWQRSVVERSAEVDMGENVARFSLFCLEQLGPLSALLALALLLGAAIRWPRAHFKGAVALSACCALSVSLTKLTYPFSPINPDFSGYLAAAAPSLCLLLTLAAYELTRRAAPLVLLLLCLGAASQPRLHGGTESRWGEVWARALGEELPTDGALWSSHYATHFSALSLRATEGWRPDIKLIFRGHRLTAWLPRRVGELPSPYSPLARFEVEGASDQLPVLRREARATGLLWSRSSRQAQPEQPLMTPLDRLTALEERWREVALRGLGDLTPAQLHERSAGALTPSQRLTLGLDARYGWALYHEAHLQWLSVGEAHLLGVEHTNDEALRALERAHLKARDAWLSEP